MLISVNFLWASQEAETHSSGSQYGWLQEASLNLASMVTLLSSIIWMLSLTLFLILVTHNAPIPNIHSHDNALWLLTQSFCEQKKNLFFLPFTSVLAVWLSIQITENKYKYRNQ